VGEPCAIGRVGQGGAWVGFVDQAGSYRLAVGLPDRVLTAEAEPDLLLALAIAYFEDALDDPPPDREATHADVGRMVRHVASHADSPERRSLLEEAVDAIDDGLAEDAVINRLAAARAGTTKEQADPVDLLLERVRVLLGGG
jgi:hypothetical protein